MLNEDEEPRQRPKLVTPPLDPLGVEELRAYIADLQAEIARAEAQIARKLDMRSAADNVFNFRNT